MFLIKVDSAGPVFFAQKRIGKDNEEFFMFKFRTMRVDTPRDVPTHLFHNPQDYVTRVGKVLRKTSLDELPQLWNILKGEMTFIGPRPALYNQDDLIELRTKCGVHKLRPGVTGWAQVNGRDEISIEEKVLLDEYYYKNRSLNLDVKIIVKTLSNVATSKNIKA
jgi:O-antigen biosynthesis protein WbqP